MKTIEDTRLVRRYISEAILNSHAAIKSCWLVMFTAGTFAALTNLNAVLRCFGVLGHPASAKCSFDEPLLNYCLAFVIFFLTFARFYLGDVRLFDNRYSEVYKLVNDEIDLHGGKDAADRFSALLAHNDRNMFKFEGIWLLFQTLMVVFLAYQIDAPSNFVTVYIVLLICNAIWLEIMNQLVEPTTSHTLAEIFPFTKKEARRLRARFPRIASNIWAVNNVCHAVALLFVQFLAVGALRSWGYPVQASILGANTPLACLLICLSNCAVDFLLAWNLYFPRFSQFYRLYQLSEDGGLQANGAPRQMRDVLLNVGRGRGTPH